eukprot:CAMPEP_0115092574 /NCGR_PEP_ID=MMETSP0227-20121206/26852_1 /TAXON_ID=89957 /ORGANISM="Polarella glacialis, Strain CCMP 1383" /LENGTH=50 /DNA_ID=CAMNT_0002484429 /DNA_START=16 /DNA_END=164 /DNA_ORIENTATION=-
MAQSIIGQAAPDMELEVAVGGVAVGGASEQSSLHALRLPGQAMVVDFFAP